MDNRLALAETLAVAIMLGACGEVDPSSGITCEGCSVERVLIATITDSTFGPGALIDASSTTVFVTSDTTFIVIAGENSSELFVADRSGAIDRQVGVGGGGPGEYRRPVSVMETSSSYLVLDDRLGRISHLSKSNYQHERTIPVPTGAFLGAYPAAFTDGSFVMWAQLTAPAASSQLIHLFSEDGEPLASFGAEDSLSTSMTVAPAGLAPSGDTAVWVADYDRYRIRLFERTGRPLVTIEREVEWFPWPEPEPAAGQQQTRILGVHEDANGRLWVQLRKRRRIEQVRTVERGGETFSETRVGFDPDPSQSAISVEVIDPFTQGVIASFETQGVRANAMPGGEFQSTFGSAETGLVLIEVWGFRLR